MARKQAEALALAKSWVGRTYPHGWCQKWVVTEIFASGGVGDWDGDKAADAEDGWKAAKKKVTTSDPSAVPAGLPIYFLGGSKDYGHAAVSAGDGQAYSTDRPSVGRVGHVSIKSIEQAWGVKFVGYVIVDGNGHNFLDSAPPSVTPENVTYEVIATPSLNGREWPVTGPVHESAKQGTTVTSVGYTAVQSDGQVWVKNAAGRFFSKKYLKVPEASKTILNFLHWNVAGSNKPGYADSNATRGPAVGAYAKEIGFDVFLACESGQSNLKAGINTVLNGFYPWESKAKGIWFDANAVKYLSKRKTYAADPWYYLKSPKYGAAFFGVKDGIKFSILEVHTDYRKPAKQARQVQALYTKWRADTDALGIRLHNTFVVGDLNWDGTAGDNPFNALAGYKFEEKGNRTTSTFKTGKHLDGVLAHQIAPVEVKVWSRKDLSDHNPVKVTCELKP